MQRQTQGQAADAATDDQDLVHVSSRFFSRGFCAIKHD
jgi:hypothetical protein